MRELVADSGPLIVLARLERLDLLGCAADRIVVPDIVAGECTRDLALPGAQRLAGALPSPPFQVEASPSSPLRFPEGLGPGERAAIVLALAKEWPLLVDDRKARTLAVSQGLKVLGVPGLLLLAKQKRVIPWIRPLLDNLSEQNYFLSPSLRGEILRRAGE